MKKSLETIQLIAFFTAMFLLIGSFLFSVQMLAHIAGFIILALISVNVVIGGVNLLKS